MKMKSVLFVSATRRMTSRGVHLDGWDGRCSHRRLSICSPVAMIMSKGSKDFSCPIREKTDTVFRKITTGDVSNRLEKAALLKALRIERERPTRLQTIR